jgi:hypothetical protein
VTCVFCDVCPCCVYMARVVDQTGDRIGELSCCRSEVGKLVVEEELEVSLCKFSV